MWSLGEGPNGPHGEITWSKSQEATMFVFASAGLVLFIGAAYIAARELKKK